MCTSSVLNPRIIATYSSVWVSAESPGEGKRTEDSLVFAGDLDILYHDMRYMRILLLAVGESVLHIEGASPLVEEVARAILKEFEAD
jgi:hypothetical protein